MGGGQGRLLWAFRPVEIEVRDIRRRRELEGEVAGEAAGRADCNGGDVLFVFQSPVNRVVVDVVDGADVAIQHNPIRGRWLTGDVGHGAIRLRDGNRDLEQSRGTEVERALKGSSGELESPSESFSDRPSPASLAT